MKITVKEEKKTNYDVKYLCASLDVRYWEDASINGVDDISYDEQQNGEKPRMPLIVENPQSRHRDDKWLWEIKIDLETGIIKGWPEGVTADIHYKVCDQGIYWLEDEDGNEIHKIESYVPSIFDFYDDSYGDYVIMTIDGNGKVVEWDDYDKATLKTRMDEFLDDEGF